MTRTGSPRVLQVVLSLNPGGTERLVVEMVRRLHGDMPMAVCCLDDEGAWAAGLKEEGVAVTALTRPSGFHPVLGRAVAAAAARHGANVVHCHHYSPFVYGALARIWRPSSRVVFTEHGRLSDVAPSPRRRLANRALGLAPRGVYTVSSELREHLLAEGFSPKAVGVIYNGIAIGPVPTAAQRQYVREALKVTPETTLVASVARLDRVKDLETLIAAVGRANAYGAAKN